jgi:hypothetical protein
MPIPNPNRGETQSKFISRCISFVAGEGTPVNQAAAICHDKWRNKMQKITEDADPKRLQTDRKLGSPDYSQTGTIAGQYEEIEGTGEKPKSRFDADDLDEILPIA